MADRHACQVGDWVAARSKSRRDTQPRLGRVVRCFRSFGAAWCVVEFRPRAFRMENDWYDYYPEAALTATIPTAAQEAAWLIDLLSS